MLKKLTPAALALLLGSFLLVAPALAAVTVTPASGGTNIPATKAVNGGSPAYTTLGNIVITEGADTDISDSLSGATVILTAPAGWRFNAGVGSVSHAQALPGGEDITSATISVTSSTITIGITTDSNANKRDSITVSGIQVQALDYTTAPTTGNIMVLAANPGTTSIAGIANDSTNFGSLSQAALPAPVISAVSMPAGTYKIGSTVTTTISADATGYTAGAITVNGVNVAGTLVDNGNTTYTVVYTVSSGNTDVAAVDVPAASVVLSNSGQMNAAFTTVTESGGDVIIDANAPSLTLSSTSTSPTNANPLQVSATFSESVTGFADSDIVVGNGTVANFAGSGASYTFEVIPSADGPVTVDAAGAVAQDAAGNDNTAAVQLSRNYDGTVPVISEVTAVPALDNDSTPDYSFSSTEAGSINYGGSCSSATSAAIVGTSTITFNTLSDGTYSDCTVTVTDAAGNTSNQLNLAAFTVDTTSPSVTLSSTSTDPTNTSPIQVLVLFSESVTGFTSGSLTLSNGTVSNFAGSGDTYTFDLTPSGQGSVTVDVLAAVAQDGAGNNNTAATQFSRVYDSIAPTISEVTPVPALDNDNTPDYTFTSDENGMIVFGGDCSSPTTAAVSGSNTSTFSALADGAHSNCTIQVQDAAGNMSNLLSLSAFTVDTLAPSVAITSASGDPTNANPIAVTVTFSENVTGFVSGDIVIGNGALSNFAGSGSTYTFDLTPSGQGSVTVDVAAAVAADGAGNNNTMATQFTRVYDSIAPTVSEVTPVATPDNDSTPDYTFTTNEAGSISYGGSCSSATSAAIVGSNTITFNTLADGTYSDCTVNVTDAAGNISNQVSVTAFTVDTTPPTIALTAAPADPTNANPIAVTVTFSENVTGFTSGDVTVGNGSISNFAGSGDTYTFDLIPSADGLVTVDVAGAVAQDAAGNDNTAAIQLSRTSDTTPPVILEVTPVSTPDNDSTPDYSFSSTEAGSISYGGSCSSATSAAVMGTSTITFNTLADGNYSDCTITVTDTAGNASNQLAISAFTVDTTGPVITLNGTDPMYLSVGNTYVEPSATALDAIEGATAVVVGGDTVTTTVPAVFQVTYDSMDSVGNTAVQVTRTVNVLDIAHASPTPGSYDSSIDVEFTAASSTSIRFTVDGTTPTFSTGILYTGPITIYSNNNFKVVACYPGNVCSDVQTFFYNYVTGVPPTNTGGSSSVSGGGGGGGGGGGQVLGANTSSNTSGSTGTGNATGGNGGQVLGASAFRFTRNLSFGMRGTDVMELQKILKGLGFFQGEPTGYFGSLTLAAVKAYQSANGISPVSGFVGPLTLAKLNGGGQVAGASTNADLEAIRAKIAALQAELAKMLGGM